MYALTFHGRENIHYETVPDPLILAPTDVIVQVKACAICGSDLHPYYEREKGLDHGCVMGHEFVGVVVERGKSVQKLQKGDKVMSPFTTSCGECFYCRRGLTCRCEKGQLFGWVSLGHGLQGGQAEYVRVPMAEHTLVQIPEALPEETALLLGDILSTGFFCADQADIRPSEVQVIVGCGPVGLMTIWAARKLGAEQVFAIDGIPSRLRQAKAWGAIPINYLEENPVEIILSATMGRGADAVMEVVGSTSAGRSAFELLRPGGVFSAVGVCTDQHLSFSPVEAYDKNLTYKVGRCPARHYMEKLIEPAITETEKLNEVFTHRVPLSEGVENYQMFSNREDGCMKILLYPGE